MPKENNICFVISPIGEEGSLKRKRSDDLLEYIIRPVSDELNLIAQRADEIGQPGNITSQIVRMLVESKMVVADLTDRNPNVFYELAIRHALKKPVVLLFSDHEELPFDIKIYRAIRYDITDYAMREPVMKELRKQIESQLHDEKTISNPFADALPTISLENSNATQDEKLMSIVRMVESLGNQISSLGHSSRYEDVWSRLARNTAAQTSIEERPLKREELIERHALIRRKLNETSSKTHKTEKDAKEIKRYLEELMILEDEIKHLDES